MKRLTIGLSLLPPLLLLCIGFTPASPDSNAKGRVTLQVRKRTAAGDNWEKAVVVFRHEEIYAGARGPHNEWDLLYGGLSHNGDNDWFKVNCDREGWSRIRDLGELNWSDDIKVPVLPILPCTQDKPCGGVEFPSRDSGKKIQDEDVNPHIAKPVAGHMYVVHRQRDRRPSSPIGMDFLFDYYALFRVEELKPNESCTIAWKRIPTPMK